MAVLDTELLLSMRDLPLAVLGCGAVVGISLWLTGWWLHRFWITLIATVAGGMIGLMYGPELGVKQSVVAGVLLAMASGCLALSLARVTLFGIYGLAVWYLTALVTPQWAVPLVCVTVGGLLSIWCFRFCMSVLTCSLASVLLSYCGAIFAEVFLDFRVTRHLGAFPWVEYVVLGIITLLGVGFQFRLQRAQDRAAERRREKEEWNAKMASFQQHAEVEVEQERFQGNTGTKRWRLFGRRRAS